MFDYISLAIFALNFLHLLLHFIKIHLTSCEPHRRGHPPLSVSHRMINQAVAYDIVCPDHDRYVSMGKVLPRLWINVYTICRKKRVRRVNMVLVPLYGRRMDVLSLTRRISALSRINNVFDLRKSPNSESSMQNPITYSWRSTARKDITLHRQQCSCAHLRSPPCPYRWCDLLVPCRPKRSRIQ